MIKRKRLQTVFSTLFLTAVLASVLVACTQSPPPKDTTEAGTTDTETTDEVGTDTTADDTTVAADTTETTPLSPEEELRHTVFALWEEAAQSLVRAYGFRYKEREITWRTDFTCALLAGDGTALAEALGVSPAVYACYDGIVISDWSIGKVSLGEGPFQSEETALTVTVTESNAPALPVGEHTLVLADSFYPFFSHLDSFPTSSPTYTFAEKYVLDQICKSTQFGICDFIVGRLDTLAGDDAPRTAEEIREYARVCLDIDPDTLEIQKQFNSLHSVEGGYKRIGRGHSAPKASMIGEEMRGDTTVVTVCFWADFSGTVEAKVVEYHLEMTEIDYKLADIVTLRDSGFAVAEIPGT